MQLNSSISVEAITQQRWAGLGLAPKNNNKIFMVNGTFTVPTCYRNNNSLITVQGVSTWLGIGGNGTTLFQAGVICSNNGSIQNDLPFYEVLNTTAQHNNPATLLNDFITISKGNLVNIKLELLNYSDNLWRLTIHDFTTQNTLYINFTNFHTRELGNHVEWIAESLEANNTTFLSPFSPITFSNMSFESCNTSCANHSFEQISQNNTYTIYEYFINQSRIKTNVSYFSNNKFVINYK